MQTTLEGGFADPVMMAQSDFRAAMGALANPGVAQQLVTPATTPAPLTLELASVALTLLDHDTPVWLDAGLRATANVREFLSFHTGAPVARETGRAAFAFATDALQLPALCDFHLGTQEYPDRSTTVVLAVPALTGGPVRTIRGPGIKDRRHFSPFGLPGDFLSQWIANIELFPRGIDLLLVADGHVLGLPRTTRISEEQ